MLTWLSLRAASIGPLIRTKVNVVSDRLAVSAAFSVLMMSAFVLFGPVSTRVEFGPAALRAPSGISAPAGVSMAGASILSFN
jgi:hypothetical protein